MHTTPGPDDDAPAADPVEAADTGADAVSDAQAHNAQAHDAHGAERADTAQHQLFVGDEIMASLLEDFPTRSRTSSVHDEPDAGECEERNHGSNPSSGRFWSFWGRHRVLSLAFCILGLFITVSSWSYVESVTAPGKTDSLGIRSVEWLRDNRMGWFVNSVERWWYTGFGKPPEGGDPDRDIQIAGAASDTPTTEGADRVDGSQPSDAPDHTPPPQRMISPVAEPMPGEGEWQPVGEPVGGIPGMYATQIRPDAIHTSILGLAVWMDPKLVRFQLHPGSTEPGGTWSVPPLIAPDQYDGLMAAFNSGFKLNESQGGFYMDGREAIPLRAGQATMVIRDDGTMGVGQWGRDYQMGPDIVAARQNLALIVDDGAPVPGLENDAAGKWGNTLGGDVLVWRSGVGETADGAIVYVTSDGLTAVSLADMLVRAGAVRGMELDINHAWTQFNIYATNEAGEIKGTKGLPDMMKGGDRYLSTESRDFVSVHRREL